MKLWETFRYELIYQTSSYSTWIYFMLLSVLTYFEWNGEIHETRTGKDGFFKFEWKPVSTVTAGWVSVRISYVADDGSNSVIASSGNSIFVPHPSQYSFISILTIPF